MIKKLYTVRAWVNERDKRTGGYKEHPYKYEAVVVDNLDTAKVLFDVQVSELRTWDMYRKYSGKVTLCEPHVYPDGQLAYWPDDNNYIDTWEFNM